MINLTGKTGILTLVGIITVVLALIGGNFAVIAGLSLTWVVMIWIILELMGVTASIPILKQLSGKSNPTTITYIFVALLLINFGVIGSVFSGAGSGTGTPTKPGGISLPQASVTTVPTSTAAASTGTGVTYQGKIVLSPQAAVGGTYTGSGTLVLFNGMRSNGQVVSGTNFDRYDAMQNMADSGGASNLLLGTDTAPAVTVSSGDFTFKSVNAKVGDVFQVFGYQDTTPAEGENRSWITTIKVTGYSDNNQQLQVATVDGSSSTPKWTNYGTQLFYDNTETARTSYLENQATALTSRPYDIFMFPTNNGEETIDAALYTEAASSAAGNMKQAQICSIPQFGDSKCVTYTVPQNADLLGSGDSIYLNAPTKTTSTDSMYYWGKFPADAIRQSSSEKGKFRITLTIDHPGTGTSLYYPKVQINSGAKANSNGKIAGPTFTINQTTSGTTGYS